MLEAELPHQRGGEENPLTDDEVRAKYAGNAALALGAADAAALEEAVLGVEDLPALDVFAVLEPRSRARSRHGVRRPGRSRICSMDERPRCQARLTATCQGRAPSPLR